MLLNRILLSSFFVLSFAQANDIQDKLYEAIARNSASEIRTAIEAGADVNKSKNGNSPLFMAVLMKNSQAVEELLNYDLKDSAIDKILEICVNLQSIKSAILIGMKYEKLNKVILGQPLLHHALRCGDIQSVLLLIRSNPNWRYSKHDKVENFGSNSEKRTIMECVLAWYVHDFEFVKLELIQELINRGYSLDDIWTEGWGINRGPDIYCCTEVMKVFLKNGADPNYVITNFEYECASENRILHHLQWTPLTRAVYLGWIETVKVLLDYGADINQKAVLNIKYSNLELTGKQTVLSIAIKRASLDSAMVKFLLERGASL